MQQNASAGATSASIIARSPEIIGAEMEGGIVLLQTSTWTYLDLNETGVAVWKSLKQQQSLASLVRAMTEQFDVDAASCRRDVEAFIDDLAARKFVTVATSAESPR